MSVEPQQPPRSFGARMDDWLGRHPRGLAAFMVFLSVVLVGAQLLDDDRIWIWGRILAPAAFLAGLLGLIFPKSMPKLPTAANPEPEVVTAENEREYEREKSWGCVGCVVWLIGILIGVGWLIHGFVGE